MRCCEHMKMIEEIRQGASYARTGRNRERNGRN